ncbi:hypothetical protein L1049_022134 [Liquidambar formosana]|uniref:Uncharacterized protein n=1 Tax=Liquidambar formosana TaxID=63359 RepID=A0AAP0RDC5_LIQFO
MTRLAVVAMAGLVAEGLKYEKVVGQSADLFTPGNAGCLPQLVSDQVLKLKQLTVLTLAERSKGGDLNKRCVKIWASLVEPLYMGRSRSRLLLAGCWGFDKQCGDYVGEYARFFHEVDDELLTNLIKVNVEGTTKVTQSVLPGMLKRKKGAIVNIGSSVANVIPSDPLYVVYAGTKGYIDQFSRCLYVEYKNSGIDVQCQVAKMIGYSNLKWPLGLGCLNG